MVWRVKVRMLGEVVFLKVTSFFCLSLSQLIFKEVKMEETEQEEKKEEDKEEASEDEE